MLKHILEAIGHADSKGIFFWLLSQALGGLKALDCIPKFLSNGDGGVVLRPHSSFVSKVPSLSNIEKVVGFTPYGIKEDGSKSPEHAFCVG